MVCCRREQIAPLQAEEAAEIRRQSDAFADRVEDFRRFFQAKAPFAIQEAQLTMEHVSLPPFVLTNFTASHNISFQLSSLMESAAEQSRDPWKLSGQREGKSPNC